MDSVMIIIISACSLLMSHDDSRSRCTKFELPPFIEVNIVQCIMGAQAQVAKLWLPTHPNWSIRAITCQERRTNEEFAEEDI